MKTILTLTGITIGFIGALCINQSYGADLAVDKCPVCEECSVCPSCKITAQRIIQDNPTITIPDEVVSFKYEGKIYTKAVLDEAKLTLDAIK